MILLALIFDVLLLHGRVVDGTGAPWFRADVGIVGDRIAAIGDLSQGALGVSSALIYQPGSYARTPKLIALARAAAKHGGIYATHLRSEGKKIAEALQEAFTIGREAKIPIEIWHLKITGKAQWGRMKEVIDLIETARTAGLDVTADLYPYIASANDLGASIPDWAHAGGTDALVARLRDPKDRARIIEELSKEGWSPETILLIGCLSPGLQKYMGKRLPEVAQALGVSPENALMDLVAADRNNIGVARFEMSEEDVQLAMRQPWTAFDLDYGARGIDGPLAQDGSAHPRAFGAMARVLGHYARDLKLFSLEEAVRKMTSLPARRLGLQDRGVLRVGMKADLAVFDPAAIRDVATFEQPLAYSEGVVHVLVNGRLVLDGGKMTKERPGRPLSH